MSGLRLSNSKADIRIMLHLACASQQGHRVALLCSVDSDVIVLAVIFFASLDLSELWIRLGNGKKTCDIAVHSLSALLGPSRCLALPLFHAFTGCDTVSQFLGCGKKTAWSAWQNTPRMTDTLETVTGNPHELSLEYEHMHRLELFVVVMFSQSCGLDRVNEARHKPFTSGKKKLEDLPPTQASLYQHIHGALLQACFFWSQETSPEHP